MTTEELFLPREYRQRTQPLFDDHDKIAATGACWQAGVYEFARLLAPGVDAKRVIDVGCGYAEKLVPFTDQFEIVGVDRESSISRCKEHYPFGTWVAADLESGIATDAGIPIEGALIICADVLEHLVNPLPLLRTFSTWRAQGTAAILLSTPERITEYGGEHLGPPDNPCHVREWSEAEFLALLKSIGLMPVLYGRVDSHRGAGDFATTLALIATRPVY